MTLARTGGPDLTTEEWNELIALKDAIKYDPASVHYDKMERFTELMVRSLEGKGDPVPVK
jgi:hypothetical protein